ncbi:hypothetical protein PHET_06646, partial [Paragonimus heterotremus]
PVVQSRKVVTCNTSSDAEIPCLGNKTIKCYPFLLPSTIHWKALTSSCGWWLVEKLGNFINVVY